MKWKVKLGLEARPETVVTRLVWATGYYVNEDYFVRDMRIESMPAHLHRGQCLIGPGGDVRLKREDEKKIGIWQWDKVAFAGSREWNGLRVLMALMNNGDLKDENNSVYRDGSRHIYMVSDLGASFGSAVRSWPRARQRQPQFVRPLEVHPPYHAGHRRFPSARAAHVRLPGKSQGIFSRVHLEHLGRNLPRADPNGGANSWRASLRHRSTMRSVPPAILPMRSLDIVRTRRHGKSASNGHASVRSKTFRKT